MDSSKERVLLIDGWNVFKLQYLKNKYCEWITRKFIIN